MLKHGAELALIPKIEFVHEILQVDKVYNDALDDAFGDECERC